jgi:hypothetical protein
MIAMNKWKTLTTTVLTASVLLLGVPAAASAQESLNYSIFDFASSGVLKEGLRGENVKIMQQCIE